jgi:hypothetical protein
MPKGDPWNGKDLDPGFSPRQYMPIKGDANGPDIDPGFSGKTDTPNFGGGDKQPDGNIYWPDGDRPGTRAGEGRCQPDPEDVLPRFNGDNIDNMPNLDPWKGKDLDPGFEIGANKPSASSAVDSLPDLILF